MKVRVPVFGTVGKSVTFNPAATEGAMIGRDLRLPDGSVPTLTQLAAALGVGSSSGGNQLAYTIWRFVGEIPENIQQAAALSSSGMIVRREDGSWTTRTLASSSVDRITVTNPNGNGGNPTIDLAEVEFGEEGQLFAITFDAYGRVIGFRLALLADLDDVEMDAPIEHDALMYDGAQWSNTPTGPRYLIQDEDEHSWTADDFVRGQNIIGVRFGGAAVVYLPNDLPTERMVSIKDEAGAGAITVRIY